MDARRTGYATTWTDGHDVYAYFNNDVDAHAVGDATELRERAVALLSR